MTRPNAVCSTKKHQRRILTSCSLGPGQVKLDQGENIQKSWNFANETDSAETAPITPDSDRLAIWQACHLETWGLELWGTPTRKT